MTDEDSKNDEMRQKTSINTYASPNTDCLPAQSLQLSHIKNDEMRQEDIYKY